MACSTLKSNILLSDGTIKPIHQLRIGDEVDTLDQHTLKRGNHKVIFIQKSNSKLVALHFNKEDIECSPNHRFYSKNKAKWIKAKDLTKGDKVISLKGNLEFISRKKINEGEIIDLTVEGAHTYISGNILSHNKGGTKIINEAPPPDKSAEEFFKYQQRIDEDKTYTDWVSSLQKYKSDKAKQQTGRSGWQSKYDTIKNRLTAGDIGYNEAQNILKDYATDYHLAPGTLNFSGGSDPRSSWQRFQIADDPDTEDIDETGVKIPEGGWTTVPTYQTPEAWENWSVDNALKDLDDLYYGASTVDADGNTIRTGGLQEETRIRNIKSGFNEVLGREATEGEIQDNLKNWKDRNWTGFDDFRGYLTDSTEYAKKFKRSYLDNYHDTLYGQELKNEEGEWTGKRTFNVNKSLLPTYGDGTAANLYEDTGVTLGEIPDQFTGTIKELDFGLDTIRNQNKFLYSAGLTRLQGTIDEEIQKLKNEGAKEVTRIGKEGDIYSSLIGGFNF